MIGLLMYISWIIMEMDNRSNTWDMTCSIAMEYFKNLK